MENKTWTHYDKSDWGDGEWQNEPDKEQWTDEATGLPCLVVRNHHGALCGYVGVPEDHRFHKMDNNNISNANGDYLEVHGGLTYSDFCQDENQEHGICHIPGDGEPEKVWWLGFDCAHSGDLCPAYQTISPNLASGTYRNFQYVKEQCRELAQQIL